MEIGKVKINKGAALAPMASIADRAFREIAHDFGACYVVSEMVSAKGLYYNDKKSEQLLYMSEVEHPCAVQLFGDEPKSFIVAAKKVLKYNPDIIDINMGCPVPKIAGSGSGAALMKNPKLVEEIIKSVVGSVDIPVTIKIRKGWDQNSVNAVEIAKIAEQSGAKAVSIHARTKEQMYAPSADWDIITKVKSAVSIPVIGNGDITTAIDAYNMYDQTGCDLVMVGRGACGNPWIFSQINEYLKTKTIISPPTLTERITVLLLHIKKLCDYKGELMGMKQARTQTAFYLKGINHAAKFRGLCGNLTVFGDLEDLCEKIYKENLE